MTDILRPRDGGCYQLVTNSWGTYLARVNDPLATHVITKEQLAGFELRTDIQRIPADLWSRWIQLCFEMTRRNRANCEVSCRLLRSEDGASWRIVVPQQDVSTVSVRIKSFDECVDITTGEVITEYPPAGWIPAGSSHSHNTMKAFFSGTDDQYEIGDPGLHVVVGTIDVDKKTYSLKASVTANNRRFDVEHNAVIDTSAIPGVSYHPDAAAMVTLPTGRGVATNIYSTPSFGHISNGGHSWWPDYDMDDDIFWLSRHEPKSISNTLIKDFARDLSAFVVDSSPNQAGELAQQLEQLQWQLVDLIDDLRTNHDQLINDFIDSE